MASPYHGWRRAERAAPQCTARSGWPPWRPAPSIGWVALLVASVFMDDTPHVKTSNAARTSRPADTGNQRADDRLPENDGGVGPARAAAAGLPPRAAQRAGHTRTARTRA